MTPDQPSAASSASTIKQNEEPPPPPTEPMPHSWTKPLGPPSKTKWIEQRIWDAWEERYETNRVEVLKIKNELMKIKDANINKESTTSTTSSGDPEFRHRVPAPNEVRRNEDWESRRDMPTRNGADGRTYPPLPPAFQKQVDDYHLKGTCRVHNPDIPQAGRDVAAHGGTAGRGGDGQHGTPMGRFAKEDNHPSYPPDDRGKPSWACLWKHEKRKPFANRWKSKTSG